MLPSSKERSLCSRPYLNSMEGKPTTGEVSHVRNLLPQPLQHINLDEFVPKVRDLPVQAHGVSGWVVLLTMAVNRLYLNCPYDIADCALDVPPTLEQLEALWHLAFWAGVFLRNSPESFEVIHGAKELAKRREECDGEA